MFNPKIHHRRSIRLKGYDYSSEGIYFVSICTKNRECVFGEIVDGKMNLSPIGVIADILWYNIKHLAANVQLGDFVVMPNHIHGLLCITHNTEEPAPSTISSIIRSYKSAVSYHAHRLGFEFAWQRNFHEHIVRNNESLLQISKYIAENPQKWHEDEDNVNMANK